MLTTSEIQIFVSDQVLTKFFKSSSSLPEIRPSTCPSRIATNMGIVNAPYCAAISSNSSTSTDTKLHLGYRIPRSKKFGSILLHGAHQVAVNLRNERSGPLLIATQLSVFVKLNTLVVGVVFAQHVPTGNSRSLSADFLGVRPKID